MYVYKGGAPPPKKKKKKKKNFFLAGGLEKGSLFVLGGGVCGTSYVCRKEEE